MKRRRNFIILVITTALSFACISEKAFSSELASSNYKKSSSCQNRMENQTKGATCEKIAFTRYENFAPSIYIMSPDGSNQRKIIANGFSPKLSPQGEKILFLRYVNYFGYSGIDIFVANLDGTNISQLTTGGGDLILSPSWSHNGKQIIFVSGRDETAFPGSGRPFDIFKINLDGSNLTQLTSTPNFERDVSWSPDGRKIAFMRDIGSTSSGPFNIFIMNSDGTQQANISENGCSDFHPSWSPLGKKILFVTNCEGFQSDVFHMPEVYLMNTDGSSRTRLTYISNEGNLAASYAYYPTWSPDGSRISFTSVPLDPNSGNWEIFAMYSDGKYLVNLTNDFRQDQESTWSK